MNKTQIIISKITAIAAAIIMLQTLYFKFTAAPESVYIFTTIGLEPYGRIGIGILELIASILLLIATTRVYGALLAIGLMAGALFYHLTCLGIVVQNDDGYLFSLCIAVLVLCLVYLWCNKKNQIF